MKNILTLAIAVAAVVLFASEQASAQGYAGGYGFGAGICNAGCNGGVSRFQAPPYFAQFPPVYYNGIVRRPYGISPYAAPAGIEPVELRAVPEEVKPMTIRNPYIKNVPVSLPAGKGKAADRLMNKTTWTTNPHFVVIDEAEALAFFSAN